MQEANNINTQEKQKTKLNKTIFFNVLYCFILFILLLSVIRVPYVGQTIDSFVFEFAFGYSKYFLYLYLFSFFIVKLFKLKIKPITSKRMFLFCLLTTCFISLVLGGINLILFNEKATSVTYYSNEIFYHQMLNYNKYFIFGFNDYVDGGFIGAILSTVPGIFMIILGIILIFILYFILFKSYWLNIKNKFHSLFNKKKSRQKEHETHQFDLNNQLEKKEIEVSKNEELSINNINDDIREKGFMLDNYKQELICEIEQYKDYIIDKKNIYDLFNKFIKENNINIVKSKMTENSLYFNINIELDNDSIDKFNLVKQELYNIYRDNKFSIIISEQNILIRFDKKIKKINEVLYQYLTSIIKNDGDFNICLDDNYKPLKLNFFINSTLAISSNNSDILYGYLNALITQLGFNYKKEFIKAYYLNPIHNDYSLIKLDIGINQKISNFNKIKEFFNILKQDINELDTEFKKCNINNFYDLNKNHSRNYKIRFIIINNIDVIYHSDRNLFLQITSIANNSHKYGLFFVFVDNSKDAITFKEYDYQTIIGINLNKKTEKEITDKSSSKFINDKQVVLYKTNTKEKTKVWIPVIYNNEIELIIRTIKKD